MKISYLTDAISIKCRKKPGNNMRVINDFMDRPEEVMVLTWTPESDYKSPASMYSAWMGSVNRSKRALKMRRNGDTVYIIKI